VHMVANRRVMTLESALARMGALLGEALDWMELRDFLPPPMTSPDGDWADPDLRRSALASSFVAALELAKQGKAEIAQEETFGPLRLRSFGA
jgi:segregation and condensation protein A